MDSKKPIVFFVYNRPETTKQVFEMIKRYQPKQLFLVSDGPKSDLLDSEKVRLVRSILQGVNWPCQVYQRYRESNLSCRHSIVEGLRWVFKEVESCIILEDDCLPSLSFFDYCSILLDHYFLDEKVMSVSGYEHHEIKLSSGQSYAFSKYPSIWGWATWRRAIKDFDDTVSDWDESKHFSHLLNYLGNEKYANYWAYMLNEAKRGADHWDYAWAYHCWRQGGLAIRPAYSMIQNIGFGLEATHTREIDHPISKQVAQDLQFPLRHPAEKTIDQKRESKMENLFYSGIRRRQIQYMRNLIIQKTRLEA